MQLPPDNKIHSLRLHYQEHLGNLYDKNEIDQLFFITADYFLKLSKATIVLDKSLCASESELLQLHITLKELKTGKPLQYILGETWFYGLRLTVGPDVLIPRPETEELVDLAIQLIKERKYDEPIRILDLCTGSACIPLALKSKIANANITATDISVSALNIAKQNAVDLKLEIDFIQQDILSELDNFSNPDKFDLITANPPYVLLKETDQMHKNVLQFEPSIALFVSDEDPLIFYRLIARNAKRILRRNGIILLEINEHYGQELMELYRSFSFKKVQIHKDLQGKQRILQAEI